MKFNRNGKFLVLSFLASLCMHLGSLAQDKAEIVKVNLEECVEYALNHNYNLATAKLQEEIAETQVAETRSMGLPQVSASISANNNYQIRQAFLPTSIITGDPNSEGFTPVQFSPEYDGTANLAVSQLLFDGSYFVGLQAAKTLRDLRKKESYQNEELVVEAVTKTYYTALITKERLELLEANQSQLQQVAEETKALNENGFAEKIDVDRIQVQLNNLKTELSNARRSYETSMIVLKDQLGMSLDQPLEVQGNLEEIDFAPSEYLQDEFEFNYSDRTDYKILDVNKQLTQLDLKNNKATFLPKLYANANYGYNTGANTPSEFFNFSERWFSFGAVGVSLQWDLFTGLRRNSRMNKNKIQLRQLEYQREALESTIDLQIRQSKDNLKNAVAQLESQKQNMELAQSVYEQTQTKYKNGLGSSREVLDAETAKKEAETNYYSALYNAIISKIDLEKALGILYK